MSVTIIGHDGNVDGHEEVGSSAVKRQCAPAADAEKKNKKGWRLTYGFLVIWSKFELNNTCCRRFSYFISIAYVAGDPAANSCSLCGNVAGCTALV